MYKHNMYYVNITFNHYNGPPVSNQLATEVSMEVNPPVNLLDLQVTAALEDITSAS